MDTAPILYVTCLAIVVLIITGLILSSLFFTWRAASVQRQQATVQDNRKAKGKGKGTGNDWFEVVCKPSESNNFAIGVADRVSVVILNP